MRCRILKCFTLIELMIVISIIAVLAGMLLPALNIAREKARAVDCMGKMRQISLAVTSYLVDYKDMLPYPTGDNNGFFLTDLALSCGYMSREGAGVTLKGTFYQQFHCKSDDTPGVNMALNFFLSHDKKAGNTLILRKASSIKNPTNRMILCEVMTSFGAPTDYNHPKMRYSHHGGCAQYLMLDGHVMQNSYRNWSVTFGNDETRPKYLECWYYY